MTDQLDIDEAPEQKLTTPALEDLLRAKYDRARYALLFDVPDAVGTSQHRRIDAIAVDCWQSGGRKIQGFELKISRSDWLRELKQVNKADPFVALCDHFWLVTSDAKIAKLEEIPAAWGWMAATKTGLRIQRPAASLPGAGDKLPRSFVLGVLRKLQDDLLKSPDVAAYIAERVRQAEQNVEHRIKWATQRTEREAEELRERVKKFEEQSGIDLTSWRMGNVGELVKQLHSLGYGDGLNRVPELLEQQENALRMTLERIVQVRAQLSGLSPGASEPA